MTTMEIIGAMVALIVAWSGSVLVAYRLIKGTVDERIGDQNARITALETAVDNHKRDFDGRLSQEYTLKLKQDSDHQVSLRSLGRHVARLYDSVRELREEQRRDKARGE